MKTRGLLVLGLAVSAAFAQAELSISNMEATVTFDETEVFDLDVDQNGHELDFTAAGPPIYIDSVSSEFSSAVVEISYDVEVLDGDSISGLGLIFSGWTMGDGTIEFEENVFDGDTLVATVGGTIDGEVPFVQSDFLEFDALTSYRVEKTFTLSLGDGQNDPSLASIGLIEQNAVPEPATMGALAVGALGLLARRRRK